MAELIFDPGSVDTESVFLCQLAATSQLILFIFTNISHKLKIKIY